MNLNFKESKNQTRGITLIALIITIIILLILAGISISALTNSGLFGKANEAKLASKISEIEEFATMKIYELYAENVNNMDAVNDATITTALKVELQAKGYEIKDVNTTSESVKGLRIQDSTGQNNFDTISLLQQKNTTIKVDLDTTSQGRIYVKIYNNWHELIINDKTVKVSREKSSELTDSDNKSNTYEIKLTPPTSGITMIAGETEITGETTITPGALIKIQAGNDTGTFAFNVIETTSSIEKNIDVNVTANPAYATDLSIEVEGGKEAEVAPDKTLQLVATKAPESSTDKVIWKIESGSATIDSTGLVKANSDSEIGSKIIVSATCSREDGTESTVGEKKIEITVQKNLITLTAQQIANNPKTYYGKKVENYKVSDNDTNIYRIFYVSTTDNEFGDPQYTIYLKADSSGDYNINDYASYDSTNTKVRTMNPQWNKGETSSSNTKTRGDNESNWNTNEKAAAYLCSPVNETTYLTTSLPWKSYYKQNDVNINYVIGGPSIEMYVKSYNQTHDKDNNGNDAIGCQYQTKDAPGYGYNVYGSIQNSGWNTNSNTLDYSNTYNSMYCGRNGSKTGGWWIASPNAYGSIRLCYIYSSGAYLDQSRYYTNGGLSPLVSLKSDFQPKIEQ